MSRHFSIDHVEFFVPDRRKAAEWYRDTLGLTIIAEFEFWADDPGGPLMISGDGGATKLALFQGEPQTDQQGAGFRRVAFRADGEAFLHFIDDLANKYLVNRQGQRLTADDAVDHQRAFSIYFVDTYGYAWELTTYDYELVATGLEARQS